LINDPTNIDALKISLDSDLMTVVFVVISVVAMYENENLKK